MALSEEGVGDFPFSVLRRKVLRGKLDAGADWMTRGGWVVWKGMRGVDIVVVEEGGLGWGWWLVSLRGGRDRDKVGKGGVARRPKRLSKPLFEGKGIRRTNFLRVSDRLDSGLADPPPVQAHKKKPQRVAEVPKLKRVASCRAAELNPLPGGGGLPSTQKRL